MILVLWTLLFKLIWNLGLLNTSNNLAKVYFPISFPFFSPFFFWNTHISIRATLPFLFEGLNYVFPSFGLTLKKLSYSSFSGWSAYVLFFFFNILHRKLLQTPQNLNHHHPYIFNLIVSKSIQTISFLKSAYYMNINQKWIYLFCNIHITLHA